MVSFLHGENILLYSDRFSFSCEKVRICSQADNLIFAELPSKGHKIPYSKARTFESSTDKHMKVEL